MPREMAATVLGAGGAPGQTSEPAPAADELEPGGAGVENPDDSAAPKGDDAGQPEGGAPDGSSTPDKRLHDTQAALHRAKAENKTLIDALSKILPAADTSAAAPDGQPAPAPRPQPVYRGDSGIPTKQLPNGEVVLDIPLPLTVQDIDEAFQHNSNKDLDDRTAFHRAFGGLLQRYHEKFIREVTPVLGRAFSQMTTRQLMQRSGQMKQATAVRGQIEGYWKTLVPQIPAKFIWTYAQEAAQAHPGRGPKAIGQQALYCVSRALEDFGGAVEVYRPDQNDTTRAQDALLRPGEGGSGRPAMRPGAPATTSTMVDQIRNANRGVRGG